MSASIKFAVNHKIYIKNPEESELGKKIIFEGVKLIEEIGFENFTFRKLSSTINSTESSIYRYFENKYKFLIYLISCYWTWLNYQIEYHTININNPGEKIKAIIKILSGQDIDNFICTPFKVGALHKIAIWEASKAFLKNEMENGYQDGVFHEYKLLCENISKILKQANPEYPFPCALAVTLLEAAHHQTFLARYFPGTTELKILCNGAQKVTTFLERLVFSSLYQSSNLPENHE